MADNTIKINIDGQESLLTLQQIDAEIEKLSRSMGELDEASDEFKELSDKIKELKEASKGLQIKVSADTKPAQSQIDALSADEVVVPVEINDDLAVKGLEELKDEAVQPIDFNLDTDKAATSISVLRAELKQALSDIANSDVGSVAFEEATVKAAKLKDQINDVNEAVAAQTGEPIERLNSQFLQVSDSVSKLDFTKASEQFKVLRTTMQQTDFSELGKQAKDFGKTVVNDLGSAFKSLAKTLLANPLLLLATVFVGLVAVAYKFRDSIKPLQVIFDGIGESVDFVIDKLKAFSDAIGLSNFQELDAIEKTQKAYEKKEKTLDQAYKNQIARNKALGKSEQELLDIENKYVQDSIKNVNTVLAAGQKELDQLQKKVDSGKELSSEEQERYDKLAAAQQRSIDLSNQELDLLRRQEELSRTASYDRQRADATIAANNAKTDKERLAAQKQILDLQREEQIGAIIRGRTYAELTEQELKDIELIKSNSAKAVADTTKNYTDKWKAAAQQRNDTIKGLNDEYLKTEQEQLVKQYDDQLKTLSDLGIKEGQLVDAINAKKLQALKDYDDEQKRVIQEQFDKQADLENELLRIQIENREKDIETDPSLSIEKRKQLELSVAKELSDFKIKAANEEAAQQERLLSDRLRKELENATLTEEQRKALSDTYDLEIQANEMRRDQEVSAAKMSLLDKERELVAQGLDKELETVLKKREELQSQGSLSKQIGLLGLSSDLDAVNASLQAEADILKSKREQGIIDEEAYQAELTRINKEGSDARQTMLADAVAQTQQLVTQLSGFLSEMNSIKMQDLDTEEQELRNQYDQRRKWIEDNISDEEQRAKALSELDAKMAGDEKKIDAQRLKLQKEQIKRDRNVAIAQILLSNAQALAGAVKSASTTGNPVAFAITLAAMLATIALTIKNAKSALAAADAAANSVGAGGGGSSVPDSSQTVGSAAVSGTPEPVQPSTFNPTGVNNIQGQPVQGQGQAQVIQPVVSVIDIEAARNRVSVAEIGATIE